jgi:hypothetical protein
VSLPPGAFSANLGAGPRLRRDPYLPGDDAANEPDNLSDVSSAQPGSPARSRTGGATAVSPGAGTNPTGAYAADPSHFGTSGAGNPEPNIIRDRYAPDLQDVATKLQSAYAAPRPGMFRQVAGALLSRKNPAIGGLVSGETQRARTIEPLQEQYGLLANQIAAQRAANTADVTNQMHMAEAGKDVALGQQASAGAQKDIAEVNAAPGKQALTAAQTEAANYKDDPNLGLIDLRTKQPVSSAGTAPLSAEEAKVLGKNAGDTVPLKLKNTANEIVNRGYSTVQTEEGVYEHKHGETGPGQRLGTNPKMMFAPSERIIPAAADPNNPGNLTFHKAGEAMASGYAAPGSAPTVAAKATLKSATSGDIGKNVTNYTTAIAHAQQLQAAADHLDNGDLVQANKIGNALGYQFGSDKATNYNVIKNALAGEVSKVFKGGQATDAEIRAVEEPFNSANSPAQIRGAIKNAVALMNSKRDALKQQVDQGMKGKPNFPSTYTPPSGAPSATGPNGHKIVVDGGKWVDAQTGAPLQ